MSLPDISLINRQIVVIVLKPSLNSGRLIAAVFLSKKETALTKPAIESSYPCNNFEIFKAHLVIG